MKFMKSVLVVSLMILAVSACSILPGGNNGSSSSSSSSSGGGTPVETKKWVSIENGYVQFKTNDPQNTNKVFYTWYNNNGGMNLYSAGTIIEANVKKISGYNHQGFGIIFGYTNDNSVVKFYYIYITVNGSFKTGYRTGNNWTTNSDWTYTSSLITGYNQENTIKVSNNFALGKYDVYFNGQYANSYPGSFTNLSGGNGQAGYITGIGSSSDESFPSSSSECHFKMLAGTN